MKGWIWIMSDHNDNRGPGGWRPTDSLDMGTGSKGLTLYSYCSKCKHVLFVNRKTAGIICPHCKKYTSIGDKFKDIGDLPQDVVFDSDNSVGHAHIRTPEMQAHMDFRKDMEIKAYAFKDKQVAKQQAGESQRFHGPLNTKTGEFTK